ncbi:hypothetical protein BDZ91DRAFT_825617 [Kalaharituber pfeilii]|nr:hypothetical protein BDZ91DRAFT_825617 [Kalaharituber pfeilii]
MSQVQAFYTAPATYSGQQLPATPGYVYILVQGQLKLVVASKPQPANPSEPWTKYHQAPQPSPPSAEKNENSKTGWARFQEEKKAKPKAGWEKYADWKKAEEQKPAPTNEAPKQTACCPHWPPPPRYPARDFPRPSTRVGHEHHYHYYHVKRRVNWDE